MQVRLRTLQQTGREGAHASSEAANTRSQDRHIAVCEGIESGCRSDGEAGVAEPGVGLGPSCAHAAPAALARGSRRCLVLGGLCGRPDVVPFFFFKQKTAYEI